MTRVCQECFKGVFSSFKGVLRVFERSLKSVSGEFQWYNKGVSKNFQRCFKEVLRVFQESFKVISRKFQGYLNEDEGCFEGVFSWYQCI